MENNVIKNTKATAEKILNEVSAIQDSLKKMISVQGKALDMLTDISFKEAPTFIGAKTELLKELFEEKNDVYAFIGVVYDYINEIDKKIGELEFQLMDALKEE